MPRNFVHTPTTRNAPVPTTLFELQALRPSVVVKSPMEAGNDLLVVRLVLGCDDSLPHHEVYEHYKYDKEYQELLKTRKD